MTIPITSVPQADELSKVIAAVEAVAAYTETTKDEGASDNDIAESLGFTDRQGRYYRLAGELLGLLVNEENQAFLTDSGKKFVVLDDDNRMRMIRTILQGNEFFKLILALIEKQSKKGITRQGILDYLYEIIEGAKTTIDRRFNTLISWLVDSSLVLLTVDDSTEETAYKFNDLLDDEDFYNEELVPDSIYPSNYGGNELDIKETHMQVVGLIRKKEQGKFKVPEFQRNQVWKQQQKSKFIESLILNIPVPPFYVSQDLEGNNIIIDGLQRSTAIFEFFADDYKLMGLEALPTLNGKIYSELEEGLRVRIQDRELMLYILKPSVPMPIVYDIFNRINSNGTPLTSQEIRNCIFIGKSTTLLRELSELPLYIQAIDKGLPPLRMKDREAILRIFAFMLNDYRTDYKGDLDDFLGKTMRRINRMSDNEILDLKKRFKRIMTKTFDFFQYENFRLPSENGRGKINIAVMEVVCLFFDRETDTYLDSNKKKIVSNFKNKLLSDFDFLASVRSATGSPKNVTTRFDKTFDLLKK